MNRHEYSKIITAIVVGGFTTLAVAFIVFVCYEMHRLGDLSPVTYLGPSSAGVIGATVAMYMNRAKWKSQTDLQYEQVKRMSELKKEYKEDFVNPDTNFTDEGGSING